MAYTKPALNAVNFVLTAYTKPALNAVNFEFAEAAGGNLSLSGIISGVSTVSGATTKKLSITGSISGVSTVAGAMSIATPGMAVSGTISGVATVSGTMTRTLSVAGSVAGVATVAGTTTKRLSISGAIAGISTVAGTITRRLNLIGSISGIGTVRGTLSRTLYVSGQISGTATVYGTFNILDAGTTGLPFWVNVGGVWQRPERLVNVADEWKDFLPRANVGGVWYPREAYDATTKGYWVFNDNYTDISGNGHHGYSTAEFIDSPRGKAVAIAGTPVIVPYSSGLVFGAGVFTLAIRIKFNVLSGTQYICGCGDYNGGGIGWDLSITTGVTTSQLSFHSRSADGVTSKYTEGLYLDTNTWYDIRVMRDVDNYFDFRVNGGSKLLSAWITAYAIGGPVADLVIGASGIGIAPVNGSIESFRIYDGEYVQ